MKVVYLLWLFIYYVKTISSVTVLVVELPIFDDFVVLCLFLCLSVSFLLDRRPNEGNCEEYKNIKGTCSGKKILGICLGTKNEGNLLSRESKGNLLSIKSKGNLLS